MALDRVAASIGDVPAEAILASIKAIKKVADVEAMKAAGPDRRLRNFGRGKLNTRDDYDHAAGSAEATIRAVPPGLWSVVTFGADPHVIGFGRSRGGGNYRQASRNRGKRLRIGGRWVTGPVFHPGTRGTGSWTKVQRKSHVLVRRIVRDHVREALNSG